jgi:ribosomal protein S18 acetylase RimI-like enzyme
MNIRAASDADVPAIARLMTQLGYPQDETVARARIAASGTHGHAVLVAEDGDAIVGCIQVGALASLESDPFAQILALVVDENARGRKVGARLVDAAAAWAAERGYAKLRVRTNVIRKDAQRFYEGVGFRLLKEQRVYVRET